MINVPIEVTRAAWKRAGTFPANKEQVYLDHAKAQEFDQHKDKKVFEYGCGGGSDAMSYLRRGNIVWYADVVSENVAVATQRISQADLGRRAFPLVLAETSQILLAGSVFDVVNAHGVLHHIVDPTPVLDEFYRILKADGLLYVMLYTESLWKRFEPQMKILMNMKRCRNQEEAFCWCTDGEGAPYARAYTEDEGRELLARSGFSVVSTLVYNNGDFRTFKAQRELQ
jgi:ubiquinone/menaquinone biosynthesis C-methylase UbiE